jgi:hypothetical protein
MHPALDAIREYYTVFSTLDVGAIASFYCAPSMTLTPQGVFSAPDHAALAASMASLISGLKARGYGRSEFVEPQVTVLSDTAAVVRGVAVRYTSAGPELERVPISYVMHHGSAGWKIAVLVV